MIERNDQLSGRLFKWLVLGAAALTSSLAFASPAFANGNITFSAGKGSAAPPATLGPYTMTPFAADPTTDGTIVTSIPGPTGPLGLSLGLSKATVPAGGWNN